LQIELLTPWSRLIPARHRPVSDKLSITQVARAAKTLDQKPKQIEGGVFGIRDQEVNTQVLRRYPDVRPLEMLLDILTNQKFACMRCKKWAHSDVLRFRWLRLFPSVRRQAFSAGIHTFWPKIASG
jgi:hypothetical protein